ncbi:MAG: ferrous iron transport protein A, partial [Candidatus Korarchaeota archaeon]|nr:ferrous iron transport protein A [Candidatus Korarchaeota archaeon]NIU84278.1 hypothetical protein [Candidatus Thorarchaeota archaeon]NIW13821.1 hypothetical protein [Candidatus Thorarchaeota archaeon]
MWTGKSASWTVRLLLTSASRIWRIKTMRKRKKKLREASNPRNMEGVIPLTALREGEKGIVAYASGGYGLVRRLAEMGLTPDVEVEVLRRGPFRG